LLLAQPSALACCPGTSTVTRSCKAVWQAMRRFGHRKGQPDLQAREQAKPVVEDRQRVELLGKKAKDSAGEPTFEVRKLSKDVGQCTSTNAAEVMTPN